MRRAKKNEIGDGPVAVERIGKKITEDVGEIEVTLKPMVKSKALAMTMAGASGTFEDGGVGYEFDVNWDMGTHLVISVKRPDTPNEWVSVGIGGQALLQSVLPLLKDKLNESIEKSQS